SVMASRRTIGPECGTSSAMAGYSGIAWRDELDGEAATLAAIEAQDAALPAGERDDEIEDAGDRAPGERGRDVGERHGRLARGERADAHRIRRRSADRRERERPGEESPRGLLGDESLGRG